MGISVTAIRFLSIGKTRSSTHEREFFKLESRLTCQLTAFSVFSIDIMGINEEDEKFRKKIYDWLWHASPLGHVVVWNRRLSVHHSLTNYRIDNETAVIKGCFHYFSSTFCIFSFVLFFYYRAWENVCAEMTHDYFSVCFFICTSSLFCG